MRYLIITLLAALIVLPSQGFSAMDSKYKECLQRGYSVDGEDCVFPDGSKCNLEAFNSGSCGEKFMTTDYCVKEGDYVWDEDKCCDGLESSLGEDEDGQAVCKKNERTFWGKLIRSPLFWVGLVLFTLVIEFRLVRNKMRKAKEAREG